MNNISHRKSWRAGSIQLHVHPHHTHLIIGGIELKREIDNVKTKLHRKPTPKNWTCMNLKQLYFTMTIQKNSLCLRGIIIWLLKHMGNSQQTWSFNIYIPYYMVRRSANSNFVSLYWKHDYESSKPSHIGLRFVLYPCYMLSLKNRWCNVEWVILTN